MDNVIEGIRDELWFVDEELRVLAVRLINSYDELNHIDSKKVIFGSLTGGISSQKWWGKCTKLAPVMRLVPLFITSRLSEKYTNNQLDESVSDEDLDMRFIIVLNRDSINSAGGDVDKLTETTMYHELMHIDQNMEKIIDHDVKDFKMVLNKFGVNWSSGLFKNDDGSEGFS